MKPIAMKLSLCMIVKNEERFLAGCLESVRDVVDELVVVDTGSTDATRTIAERFGARVFSFEWIGDFSAARNHALQQAQGEWILYLDADERLVESSRNEVRKLLDDRMAGGFVLWVESAQKLRDGAVQRRMGYPRLFRNHPQIRFEGKVHEQIGPSIERLRMPVRPSSVVIEHLGYAQTVEIVQEKAERNLALLRAQLAEDPRNGYVRFQVGNSLDVLGQYDEARAELEEALTHQLTKSIRASVHALLAGIALRQNRWNDGVTHARESLKQDEHQALARWFLGVGLKGSGRYADALGVFEEILSVQQKGIQSANDVLIEEWKVFFHMANCYEALGDAARAGALFVLVLERNRDSSEPLEGFFRTIGKRSDLQIVLAEFDRLGVLFPQHPDLHANHAMLLRAAGRPDRAYQSLRKAQELPNAKPEYHELELSWAADDEKWDSLPDIVHRAEGLHRESFPFYRLALDLAVRRKEYAFASRILDAMLTRVFDQIPHEARTKYIALNEKISALSGGRG